MRHPFINNWGVRALTFLLTTKLLLQIIPLKCPSFKSRVKLPDSLLWVNSDLLSDYQTSDQTGILNIPFVSILVCCLKIILELMNLSWLRQRPVTTTNMKRALSSMMFSLWDMGSQFLIMIRWMSLYQSTSWEACNCLPRGHFILWPYSSEMIASRLSSRTVHKFPF